MERAEYLLLKMLEQLRRNESKEQLLNSIRLIEEEIERSSSTPIPESEAAPLSISAIPDYTPPVPNEPFVEEEKEYAVLHINEEEIDWESEENGNIILADIEEDEEDEEDEVEHLKEPEKEVNIAQSILSRFLTPPPVDALLNPDFVEDEQENDERSTTIHVKRNADPEQKELHQQWSEASSELMNRFAESPVKDLKKAIGINDRYRFINELFKGDETMFERSIKTINDFSIFPEAEFWVRRELKTKLGWNADDELVQLFDQLVRRRFS